MPQETILLVDDEQNILDLSKMYLEREQFKVTTAMDGLTGLEKAESERPDFIVLDLMLPGLDGYEVCRRIRAGSYPDVPILMLTARDDDIDKIIGLEMGADDYMTKPFNPREMVARVKAILRRSTRQTSATSVDVLKLGDVTVNEGAREVTITGATTDLRTKEFDLLQKLIEHKGMVLTREQLLSLVWGFDFYGETRTVDVHIAQLRKHLKKSTNVKIETVTGVGYKIVTY